MKKHNIARAAVSAGLAIAMTFGGVAPATMAFADTAANSTITINNVTGNQTSFKGYQIFKADVVDGTNGGKTVSNIAWAGDTTEAQTAVKNAVEGVIKKHNADYAGTTAQDAADWIKDNIKDTTDTTAVASNSIANELAKAVEGLTSTASVTGGQASSVLSSGYWLFVTDSDSVDAGSDTTNGETYTSPIFTVIGGTTVTVTEKSSIPTVDKFVKNDKTGSDWGKVADSEAGQDIEYKLVGTVAQDVATYDTYYYKFTDTLSAGLTADLDSLEVKVENNGTETTVDASKYKKDLDGQTLTVTFDNLKSAGVTINPTTVVNVYYKAKLDPQKAYKVASDTAASTTDTDYNNNPNEVKLTYSNNPHSTSHGETVPHKVTDYTYKLNLVKESTDSATTKLANAKFTIQATGADEGTGTKYVQSDGSLGDDPYTFVTDKDGKISVKGLDAGTYKVVETEAPSGYNKVDDFTFTITPTWNDAKTALQSLAVSDSDTSDASVVSAVDNGLVNLTVKDKPGSGLPLTGQAGVTLTFVAGALVLAFGVSRVVRNRKEQDAE